ncbi:MAG: hypothetical protein ACJ8C4_20635 [Gemmataceae bacterium]
MNVVSFPNLEVLRQLLAAGSIPEAIAQSPVQYNVTESGEVWLAPSQKLPKALNTVLTRAGAAFHAQPDASLDAKAHSWAAVLPLMAAETPATVALFDLPASGLVQFVAELKRLRSGSIRWRLLGKRALIHVESPPLFSLIEGERAPGGPHAYYEHSDGVWVRYGYRHPVSNLVAPPGRIAIVSPPHEWEFIAEAAFNEMAGRFDLPPQSVEAKDLKARPIVQVAPTLVRASDGGAAELWVLHDDGLKQLHQWLQQADDRLVARLLGARIELAGRDAIVLTGRPGMAQPPVVVFDAAPYRPYLKLPNLFVPVNQTLRPALRRDAARRRYAPDANRIALLDPAPNGITAFDFPRNALLPLAEWVSYAVPPTIRLDASIPRELFSFETFEARARPISSKSQSAP